MNTQRSTIYDEIVSVGHAVYNYARVETKPYRLNRMELGSLYSLRVKSQHDRDHDRVMNVGLEILKREIEIAKKQDGPKPYAKVIYALVVLIRQATISDGAGQSARSMSARLAAGITALPGWAKKYIANAPKDPKPSHVRAITGMDIATWNSFTARVIETSAAKSTPASLIAESINEPVDLDVASRLSRMANSDHHRPTATPNYDQSDADVKIRSVSVTGFRGSVSTVTLGMTKNNKPADVLLWGDNGVGKSTLIDGIEFALQGRVDRSADFNSTLRASVKNLTAPEAEASVALSDGSTAQRTLVSNAAGRDEPSSRDVRPGFRLAPLVIRRADILRFLDTDALSRGTVFFDYFPDPAGSLGIRPDEELRQLEEERFLLRVARDDLAAQLREIYPHVNADFTDSSQLDTFVSEEITRKEPEALGDRSDVLPDRTRHVIGQLRTAQHRGSAIKKKLDKGVQTLNPVAYEAQLQRIVPILQAVTADLTTSFKDITRATHVAAIRVLVAKSGPVSLDVVIEFDNGMSALPQQAFSEGYKDLIALLFFLTVTKKAAEHGQARVLILDDALQSVDASIRLAVMDYVLTEFKDWQLIVTGHDRAWQAQLRGLFIHRSRVLVENSISSWTFDDGIRIAGAGRTRATSLRNAIENADETMTAAGTGLLLEEIAQNLSWRVGASTVRREGDRYTLGDLWPGVVKALRSTDLKQVLNDIDLRITLRNLLGAHYNEWADAISWSDVQQLGEDTLTLYTRTRCGSCADWVRKDGSKFQCRCGTTCVS
jgi:recombinational DNA repair ATPase RecF